MHSFTWVKFLLGFCLTVPVWGQSSKTYIVTTVGDTVYTMVKFTSKLADNNREVYALVNKQTVRYSPYEVKAYYNGLQEYETVQVGGMPVFLQRHTQGYVNLYYCDETILAQLIRHTPRIGDQIGYSLGEALGAALKSVKQGDAFEGKILILRGPDSNIHIFDPNITHSKQEIANFFYDYPGTESFLSQAKLTPEVYEQLIIAYNQWKPQAMARIATEQNIASGF